MSPVPPCHQGRAPFHIREIRLPHEGAIAEYPMLPRHGALSFGFHVGGQHAIGFIRPKGFREGIDAGLDGCGQAKFFPLADQGLLGPDGNGTGFQNSFT